MQAPQKQDGAAPKGIILPLSPSSTAEDFLDTPSQHNNALEKQPTSAASSNSLMTENGMVGPTTAAANGPDVVVGNSHKNNHHPEQLPAQSRWEQRQTALRKFASCLGTHSILGGNQKPSAAVTAAAGKLVGGGITAPAGGARSANASKAAASELTRCLFRDDDDMATGGAVCALPCLDLHSEEDDANGSIGAGRGVGGSMTNPPGIGVSSRSLGSRGGGSVGGGDGLGGVQIPAMAASVFDNNGDGGGGGDAAAPSAPGASDTATASAAATSANAAAAQIEHAAAKNLGTRTTWTRSSASQAPGAMLRSLTDSFSSLVDSRVRAWTLLLLRHSLSSGDEESRGRLLGLLATSSSIDLAVVSRFQALQMPGPKGDEEAKEGGVKGGKKEPDMVLPVIFEPVMDVTIQQQHVTVKLRAPGTISANFAKQQPPTTALQQHQPPLLTYVAVELDTNALVSSMVEQARLVVFKAVARTASLPSRQFQRSNSARVGGASGATTTTTTSVVGETSDSSAPLSTFGSSLSLSQAAAAVAAQQASSTQQQQQPQSHQQMQQQQPLLRKSAASALRLSKILHSKSGSKSDAVGGDGNRATVHPSFSSSSGGNSSSHKLSKVRKQRSVTWNHPVEHPSKDSSNYPAAKRQKRSEVDSPQGPKLRSTKSFGKPDSSFFESSRNATFSEFGRVHKHGNVPAFVNGRLHVPDANQIGGGGGGAVAAAQGGGAALRGISLGASGRSMGNLSANRNATFGGLSSMSGGGGGGSRGNASFGMSGGIGMGVGMGAVGGGGGRMMGNASFAELSRNAVYSQPPPPVSGRGGLAGSGAALPRTPTALESLFLSATGGGSSGTPQTMKGGRGQK